MPVVVSVIVPVHDAMPHLEACLGSVVAQELPAGVQLQIICVDDGSSDGSRQHLESFADRVAQLPSSSQDSGEDAPFWFEWESHPQAQGVSAARNRGLDRAVGSYVLFVDADDLLRPQAIASSLRAAQAENAQMTIFGYAELFGSRTVEAPPSPRRSPALTAGAFRLADAECTSTEFITPNVWRILFQRSFIEEHGLRFHDALRTAEDLAFIYEALLQADRIALLDEPLYVYRREGGAGAAAGAAPSLTHGDRGLDAYDSLGLIWRAAEASGALQDQRVRFHLINLILDIAEYSMATASSFNEYASLVDGFAERWTSLLNADQDLIAPRYRPFYGLMGEGRSEENLWNLYAARRDALPAAQEQVSAETSALQEGPSREDRQSGQSAAAPCSRPAAASDAMPASALQAQDVHPHVVLFGWFGADNFGDDLLMSIVIRKLEQRYGTVRISVIGADPGVIQQQFGLDATEPHQKHRIQQMLSTADALVYCGGLLFDDPMAQTAGAIEFMLDPWIEPSGQAAISLLARLYDVPVFMLGIGAGPVEWDATKKMVKLIGLSGAQFVARDAATHRLIESCGVDAAQITTKADLAFTLVGEAQKELAAGDAADGHFIVSLRDWPLNPEGLTKNVAAALDAIIRRTGLVPLFVPFDEDDAHIHSRVLENMEEGHRAQVLDGKPDERRMRELICGSQGCVAMRLHCSILHHIYGKPAVGLGYNDKVIAHFEEMGRLEDLLALDASADDLADAFVRLQQSSEGPMRTVAEAAAEKEQLANQAFSMLFKAMDERMEERVSDEGQGSSSAAAPDPPFPRTVSLTELQLQETRKQAEQDAARIGSLSAQTQQQQQEIASLRASTSYRLGQAVVKPLHRLFRGHRS